MAKGLAYCIFTYRVFFSCAIHVCVFSLLTLVFPFSGYLHTAAMLQQEAGLPRSSTPPLQLPDAPLVFTTPKSSTSRQVRTLQFKHNVNLSCVVLLCFQLRHLHQSPVTLQSTPALSLRSDVAALSSQSDSQVLNTPQQTPHSQHAPIKVNIISAKVPQSHFSTPKVSDK